MDTFKFDSVARLFGTGMTRRDALRGLVAGAAAVTTGGALLQGEDASARRRRRRHNKDNVCDGKNWCVDRSQTCGPAGGYGKCLVTANGANICAEILFQAASCEDCGPENCTDCRCVLAAGGGDLCNNGSNGYDYICVRKV